MGKSAISTAEKCSPSLWRRREFALGLAAVGLWNGGCSDGTSPDRPDLQVPSEAWSPEVAAGSIISLQDFPALALGLARVTFLALFSPTIYESLEDWVVASTASATPQAPCSVSGSRRVWWTDTDGNGRLTEGDSLRLEALDCKTPQDPRAVQGSWSLQIERLIMGTPAHVAGLEGLGTLGPLSYAGVQAQGASFQLQLLDDWAATQRSRWRLRNCSATSGVGASTSSASLIAHLIDMDVYTVSGLTGRQHYLSGRLSHPGTQGGKQWAFVSGPSQPMIMSTARDLPGSFTRADNDLVPSSGMLSLSDATGQRVVLQAQNGTVSASLLAAGSATPLVQWSQISWETLLNGPD